MDYNKLLQSIQNLEFVNDSDTADAAIKATFGKITSILDEDAARRFTNSLPDPLTYEKLRSHQEKTLQKSGEELIQEMCTEFKLSKEDAEKLVKTVFRNTKQELPDEGKRALEEKLPEDILSLVQQS